MIPRAIHLVVPVRRPDSRVKRPCAAGCQRSGRECRPEMLPLLQSERMDEGTWSAELKGDRCPCSFCSSGVAAKTQALPRQRRIVQGRSVFDGEHAAAELGNNDRFRCAASFPLRISGAACSPGSFPVGADR
jgi:hypothetical protein